MLEEHYPFVAQPLPYEYDALLPVLDEETLHFHHDRHYQTYVDKLNATLADYPQLQQMSLTELLTSEDNILASLPEEARKSIHNNGGGVYNHQLYFDSMRSPAGQEPCGALEEALVRDFGSVRQWKEQMSQAATGVFGSGWAWLVTACRGFETQFSIIENPLALRPLCGCSLFQSDCCCCHSFSPLSQIVCDVPAMYLS